MSEGPCTKSSLPSFSSFGVVMAIAHCCPPPPLSLATIARAPPLLSPTTDCCLSPLLSPTTAVAHYAIAPVPLWLDLCPGAEPAQPWKRGGFAIAGSNLTRDADSLVSSARGGDVQPQPPEPPLPQLPAIVATTLASAAPLHLRTRIYCT